VLQEIFRYRSFLRGRSSMLDAAERKAWGRKLAPGVGRGDRRYARFEVHWRALFLRPSLPDVVTVTNVGLGGLAIEPPIDLPSGDVELLVSTGEKECWRLYAHPVWRRDGKIGLAFRELPA
jgi:hypothetical protein